VGQAFIPQLVGPDLLPSGVALNAVVVSTGRLVGPALAGVLFTWRGPAACFFVNACSYGAIVFAMLRLRRSELREWTPQEHAKGQLRAGLRYAWDHPLLRSTLLVNAVVGCLAFNFPTVYASMVTFVYGASGAAFGAAESTNAIFAVIGGLVLARRLKAPTLRMFTIACIALGATLAANGLAPNLGIFIACMPFFGVAVVSYQTIGQSLVQQHTPPAMIGRVMSLYVLGTIGTTPIGAMITGVITDTTSARVSLLVGAASLFLSAIVLWIFERRRPVAFTSEGARRISLVEEEAVIAETLSET
jgi:MFS family permease